MVKYKDIHEWIKLSKGPKPWEKCRVNTRKVVKGLGEVGLREYFKIFLN